MNKSNLAKLMFCLIIISLLIAGCAASSAVVVEGNGDKVTVVAVKQTETTKTPQKPTVQPTPSRTPEYLLPDEVPAGIYVGFLEVIDYTVMYTDCVGWCDKEKTTLYEGFPEKKRPRFQANKNLSQSMEIKLKYISSSKEEIIGKYVYLQYGYSAEDLDKLKGKICPYNTYWGNMYEPPNKCKDKN